MQKVKCTKCESNFEPEVKKKINDFLHIHYFQCPECEEIYIAYVTDPAIRRAIKITQRFRELSQRRNISAVKRLKRKQKLARLIEENQQLMTRRREAYKDMIAEAFSSS